MSEEVKQGTQEDTPEAREEDLEAQAKLVEYNKKQKKETIKYYVLIVTVSIIGLIAFFGVTILTSIFPAAPVKPSTNTTVTTIIAAEVIPTHVSTIEHAEFASLAAALPELPTDEMKSQFNSLPSNVKAMLVSAMNN